MSGLEDVGSFVRFVPRLLAAGTDGSEVEGWSRAEAQSYDGVVCLVPRRVSDLRWDDGAAALTVEVVGRLRDELVGFVTLPAGLARAVLDDLEPGLIDVFAWRDGAMARSR